MLLRRSSLLLFAVLCVLACLYALSWNTQERFFQLSTLRDFSLNLIDESTAKEDAVVVPKGEYQQILRLLKNTVRQQGFLISSELKKLLKKNSTKSLSSDVERISQQNGEHQRALLSELEELQKNDGYEAWRVREAAELSDLVQSRLHFLQNPKDCSTARKIICSFNIGGCGFGCQMHRIVMCLTAAYSTQRTLILESNNWRYHKGGWDAVYLPPSNSCRDSMGTSSERWPGKNDTQVVKLSSASMGLPPPDFPPLAIPTDLASRLEKLHGYPYVWWAGQMLKYILRPQENVSIMLKETERKIGFKKPIVGVHIRRTDKKREAKYYPVEEYMSAVEEFYNVLELTQKVPVRRIYLATDEPNVVSEMKKKYPNYEILGDIGIAKAASKRYTDASLLGLITDLHFLTHSDFFVGTFSSNIGRLVYEMMQALHPDATHTIRSLDSMYRFYTGKEPTHQIVFYPHVAQVRGEMNLKVGDTVYVDGIYGDGYSHGTNLRSNETGKFPSFKATQKVLTAEFPLYPEVIQKNSRFHSVAEDHFIT